MIAAKWIIDERDNHLRPADFFDSIKYPTIRVQSSNVKRMGDEVLVTGLLTIKDIQQKINFDDRFIGMATDPMGDRKAGFEMDEVFDRKDFNISYNELFDKQGT